jgi:hypothetical protein
MPYPIATMPLDAELFDFLAALERLNYRARRRAIWNRTNPRQSRFLYKYFAFRKEHFVTNLRDVIVQSKLRLSPPIDFNDPFDMTAVIALESTVDQRRARFTRLIRDQSPGVPEHEQQQALQRLMSASDEDLLRVCRTSLETVRHTTGVYCFAGNAKNILMWSHYAGDHTGVCLQFERAHDYTGFAPAVTVDYVDDLPVVNWITDPTGDEGIGKMLTKKHPCWEYEGESRIVIIEQAGRYWPFRPEALRSIIFGCASDEKVIETVRGLLAERAAAGHPPVATYVATKHATRYQLVVRRRDLSKCASHVT